MTRQFAIHPVLQRDCILLGRFPACHLLLHRNATIPWLILVPKSDAADLFGLEEPARAAVLAECGQAAGLMRSHFGLQKINFAQIGNIVPQLHLHVVGRSEGDACWPSPVWGSTYPRTDYSQAQLKSLRSASAALPGFSLVNG
jgi:diadenosine tetraphosphate (Ap4A) HIT family hydrolase